MCLIVGTWWFESNGNSSFVWKFKSLTFSKNLDRQVFLEILGHHYTLYKLKGSIAAWHSISICFFRFLKRQLQVTCSCKVANFVTLLNFLKMLSYLTVILWGCAGYELIYITNEAVGRVGYYQLISGKSEKNNCFSKFSSNSLDFFRWNLLKSWHFLYRRRRETIFSDLQNFSTRNSPSVFPYLVKLNDNGSYRGLREPTRKLENHYPELKIY